MSENDHPFLLVKGSQPEKAEFQTIYLHDSDFPGDNQLDNEEHQLFAVCKRPGANSFSFVTIGRAKNNDIVVANHAASKCHAIILRKDDRYFIKDAGSKNGTWVNDERLIPHIPVELHFGDRIQLAQLVHAEFLDPESALRRRPGDR